MTNSPEGIPDGVPPQTPGSLTHATPAATATDTGAPVPAEGATFSRLAEPRSENRLVLEGGTWHQISPKYVRVQLIANGSFLLLVVAATLVLTLLMHQWWAWIPGGALTVILVWTLAILPRQARSIGYQLRQDDLVFRRGILWQRFVAVPYGRMQLIDINRGPLSRALGLSELKFVTAAAATGVTIPGLPEQDAEELRDSLVALAETRRVGL